ncbi:MAG: SH3 domain-containing protein [Myxococcota bacterium]
MTNLLALVLVATNTLTYSGPENRKNAPEDAFFVSSWEAGQVLFAVSPDINLRARPKVSSPVVTELPMGTPVKILRPPVARTRAAGRVDHWYPVSAAGKEGFLHGSTLTPFHWHSGNRRATVAWGPNYKILVRLLVDTELNTLPLEPGGQAYVCCGGVLRAKWIGESSAGSPMVEVFSTVEACADEVTQYVDLSGNTPRVVLETGGS